MSFEWRTEEADLDVESGGEPSPARRRRSTLWLLVLFLVLLMSISVWRLATVREAETTSALTADVRSTHELAVQALRRQDSELFRSLLSGREPQWAEAQQRLFSEELIFDGGLATFLQGSPAGSEVARITFSPNFQEAYLTLRHTVVLTEPGGVEETVTLQQPLVYRQGTRRWLLSPPTGEYWGPWRSESGEIVSLTYPQQDSEVAQDLLPLIDGTLRHLCARLNQPCLDTDEIQVHLETDPATVLQIAGGEIQPVQGRRITLPTPSLLGLPADEQAREVLYRSYALRVAAAASADVTAYRCCQGLLYFQSLYDHLLHELGLRPKKVRPSDYAVMADDLIGLQRLNQLWWDINRRPPSDGERLQIRVFMDFLAQRSETGHGELVRKLVETSGFWKWLEDSSKIDPVSERDAFEVAWRDFVLRQANEAAIGHLPGLPTQDLNLICEDETGQRGLYRYDVSDDVWTQEAGVDGIFLALAPTPDDVGVMLYDQGAGAGERQPTQLWLGGQKVPVPEDLVPAYMLPVDPQKQYMSMWRLSTRGIIEDEVVLIDLRQCRRGSGCPQTTMRGSPYWSPDGSRLLLARSGDGRLLQTRREMEALVDTGISQARSPFWLDNETYGFISGVESNVQAMPFTPQADSEPWTLLTLDSVLAGLEIADTGQPWTFGSVWRVPETDVTIVGSVLSLQDGAFRYFLAEFPGPKSRTVSEAAISPLLVTSQTLVPRSDTLFSPDGRWLAMHLSRRPALDFRFVLQDLKRDELMLDVRTGSFEALRAHDWSSDGRWLVRIGRHFVELMAPSAGKGARRFVSNGQLQCSSVAWVE